jgi:hypothetical protein
MVGVLVSVFDKEVYEIELDDNQPLKDAYEAMDCSLVDVVRNIKIGKDFYDILVDDNGLYRENKIPSAKCSNAEQVLFGNIIILKADNENGEWYSMGEKDFDNINENIFILRHKETNEASPILEYSYDKGEENEDIDTTGTA